MSKEDVFDLEQDRPRSPLKEEEVGQKQGRWAERDAEKAECEKRPEMADVAALTAMFEASEARHEASNAASRKASQEMVVAMARMEANMHTSIHNSITDAVAPFTAQLNQLKIEVADHETRLAAVEGSMAEWEGRMKERETEAELALKKGEDMQRKVSALDDSGRRNNWRCPNLPAGIEGDSAMGFVIRQLPVWFPALPKSNFPITVDRAHRVQVKDPNALQPFICRMMSHQATRAILQLAKEQPPRMKDASGKWVKLRFYSDYGPSTVQKRAEFKVVMAELWDRDIKHYLQYPAVLKVQDGNTRRSFSTPHEAQEFIRTIKPKTSRVRSPTLPPTPQKNKRLRPDARRSRTPSPHTSGEGRPDARRSRTPSPHTSGEGMETERNPDDN